MRGEILSYDSASGTGLISGDDGARYGFDAQSFQSALTPATGVRVDFVADGERAVNIVILAAAQAATAAAPVAAAGGFDFATALFSFEGRLRRSHFWIGFIILFGVSIVVGWLPVIGFLISIALIWPNVAIAVKRLHDMGKTGWFVLAPYAIGIVLAIAAFAMVMSSIVASGGSADYYEDNPMAALAIAGPALALGGLSLIVGLAFLLWIGLVDSEKGQNRFGPNPKGE